MKAFVYTLLLTAILVGAVLYLQTIPEQKKTTTTVDDPAPEEVVIGAESGTMTVKSEPARLPSIDPAELEQVNLAALYETGTELLDL